MRQEIAVFNERKTLVSTPSPDSFTLRKDRKHLWLQKAALWVLAKLDARKIDEAMAYTRHVIDSDDFMKKLFESKRAIFDACHEHPETLLIGPEEYREIMGGPLARQLIQFDAQYYAGRGGAPLVMSMRVVIVPWMSGILPITKGCT